MNVIFKKVILQFSKNLSYKVKERFLYPRLSKEDLIPLILLEIERRFESDQSSLLKVVAVLKFYGLDLSIMKDDILYDIFSSLYSCGTLSVIELESLQDSIESMGHIILKSDAWIILYEVFCAKGLYHIGAACRKHALAIYHKNIALDGDNFNMYFSIGVLLEDGINSRKEELVYNNLYHKGDVEFKSHIEILSSLLSNNDILNSNFYNFDSKFHSLIKGRSIAIVGPSNTIERDADEIDSFDLVVRLNYTKKNKGCDEIFKGVKTDIAYFNVMQTNLLNFKNKTLSFEKLNYSCFKREDVFPFIEKRGKSIKYRKMLNFDRFLWHGTFNLIPLVLMDILAYKPKKIKIFHSDLMLTQVRYKDYYSELSSNYENINKAFRSSSIIHDPVSQYKLLKKMHDLHKFSGDSGFERVMAMGEATYVKELQRLYYN